MNFIEYIESGILHVLPYGYDHILFIISIIIGLNTLKKYIAISLVFTISHTVSLFLSVMDLVAISSEVIEPIIALTILISAVVNIYNKTNINFKLTLGVIFLFGLIHGLGFASVFKENVSASQDVIFPLLGFNLGVEIAQILIVLIVFGIVFYLKKKEIDFNKRILYPVSMCIGVIAMGLLIDRLLN
jgi:hypothetical protein